jgi:hypothetical protein
MLRNENEKMLILPLFEQKLPGSDAHGSTHDAF